MIPCNTEALISSIRGLAKILPVDNGSTWPLDSDIIRIINTEIGSYLVPHIGKIHEGHFVQHTDTPIVSGQIYYPLPGRAAGNVATFMQLLDSNFNPIFWPGMQQEDLENILRTPSIWNLYSNPTWYFIEGNNVRFATSPVNNAQYLRFYYPQRPSQVVPSTSVTTITSITPGSGNYTIGYAALPTTATFSTSTALEVVNANPGFSVVAVGTPTAVNATSATFSGAQPPYINVGDSLCLQDQSNYVSWVPLELTMGLLDKWVACQIALTNGDDDHAARLSKLIEAAEGNSQFYLGKREQRSMRKISAAASGRLSGRFSPFWAR